MKKNTLIALTVVVVLLLIGAWWAFKKPGEETGLPTPGGGEEQGVQGGGGTGAPSGDTGGTGNETGGQAEAAEHGVTYTDTGFSPSTLTIKQGDTVVFKNESSSAFWPASAVHPTHLLYPGFDAKASISLGGTYSFTFNRVGTWRYHNHLNASQTGTIVVE